MSEKIAFISFYGFYFIQEFKTHLQTDEPLASNVFFAGIPSVSLYYFCVLTETML